MERGPDMPKKEAKDNVPSDRVKDAPALARELRWRLRLARYGTSDGDVTSPDVHQKRRRRDARAENDDKQPKLKGIEPKTWDVSQVTKKEEQFVALGRSPPGQESNWADRWLTEENETNRRQGMDVEDKPWGPNVTKKREDIVRVRRTMFGLERQRLHREIETWEWQ